MGTWNDLGLFLLTPSPSGLSWSPAESLRSTSLPASPLCSYCCHRLQLGVSESLVVWPTSLPSDFASAHSSSMSPALATWWAHHWTQMLSAYPLSAFLPVISPFSLSFCSNPITSSRCGGNLPALWSPHLRINKSYIFRQLHFSLAKLPTNP